MLLSEKLSKSLENYIIYILQLMGKGIIIVLKFQTKASKCIISIPWNIYSFHLKNEK